MASSSLNALSTHSTFQDKFPLYFFLAQPLRRFLKTVKGYISLFMDMSRKRA